MPAFRLIALAYALAALLIAPSWLAAQDEAVPPPVPAEQLAAPVTDAADQPVAPVAAEAPAEQSREPLEPEPQPQEPAAAEKPATAKAAADDSEREQDRVAKAAASGSVTITDFEYTPATITVNEGDTVTWVNKGPTPHTATAEDGSFDTGNLDKGESGSATFTSAGTIPYICTPHPFMKGKVVVRAAAAGDDDSGSGDGDAGSDDGAAGTAGEDAAADDGGDALPATGFETALIALLGMATLGAGLLLRRRAT